MSLGDRERLTFLGGMLAVTYGGGSVDRWLGVEGNRLSQGGYGVEVCTTTRGVVAKWPDPRGVDLKARPCLIRSCPFWQEQKT